MIGFYNIIFAKCPPIYSQTFGTTPKLNKRRQINLWRTEWSKKSRPSIVIDERLSNFHLFLRKLGYLFIGVSSGILDENTQL